MTAVLRQRWVLQGLALAEVDEIHLGALVIDSKTNTDIDTTAADEVVELVDELAWRDA